MIDYISDWNIETSIYHSYVDSAELQVSGHDIKMRYEITDWHVPNDSLYEINSSYTVLITLKNCADLLQHAESIDIADHDADVSVEITDLQDNPYYDESEWLEWLYDYIHSQEFWLSRV